MNTPNTLRASVCTIAVATIAAGALAVEASAQVKFLNIGSSSSSSSQYTYWVSVGQAIEQGTNGAFIPTVMESGASVDNLRMMRRKESELGLVTAEAAAQAYQGIGAFEGEAPMEDIRLLWCYSALPNIYVVREDANVDKLSDLEGLPYNFGIAGSSTEAQTAAVFETLGISPDRKSGSVGDAVDAIRDGHIVGMTKGAASASLVDSSFMQINASLPVKVIPISDEEIEAVRNAYPYFSAIEVPAGTYPNQTEMFRTFTVAVCAGTLEPLLTEDEAYAITKAVYENKSVQEDAYPASASMNFGEFTATVGTVPLHPGAIRYMREAGMQVPEQLIP